MRDTTTRSDASSEANLDYTVEMYGHLRDEILQSIRLQHQIVIGLASFIGLVFGLIFSGGLASLESIVPGSLDLMVAAVLPIIGTSAGIWLAEQSRVMMAGDYLLLLEQKIHNQTGNAPLSWETWLRCEMTDLPDQDRESCRENWKEIQNTHNKAYQIGYLSYFLLIGILSISLYINETMITGSFDLIPLSFLDFLKILWPLIWALIYLEIAVYARRVVTHGQHAVGPSDVIDWENNVFQQDIPLSQAFSDNSDLVDGFDFDSEEPEEMFRELVESANSQE